MGLNTLDYAAYLNVYKSEETIVSVASSLARKLSTNLLVQAALNELKFKVGLPRLIERERLANRLNLVIQSMSFNSLKHRA